MAAEEVSFQSVVSRHHQHTRSTDRSRKRKVHFLQAGDVFGAR